MPFNDPIQQVDLQVKANIYFDGKVVSHSFTDTQGNKKTLGLIFPGTYSFNTGAPERMIITAGNCRVKKFGESDWKNYSASEEFQVPANSSFEIMVENGITEYLCIFE
ncbi:MAG: pyrimidine/purine nucleoside phosphorylase [Deltaproteobacteria bacterium]|nr:pyrimidine/purine nucleoside phosphorylase [Deltaproteobacteria bacterium]